MSRYCSQSCQERDWLNHKRVCREKNNGGLPATAVYS
ncbi:MAG: zinc finger MYND domain-containing protein [Gammaproteobacteria bacterium]|nr:zinc finger MYND domain-containing protein [Gammaproteobacteria bacterium]